MKKVELQTPEQHAHAVVWLLAIVDHMIAAHKEHRKKAHLGLCALQASAMMRICHCKMTFYALEQVYASFSKLMEKHLKPRVGHSAWWFGPRYSPYAYDLRTNALQRLRAIIASGDIDPR